MSILYHIKNIKTYIMYDIPYGIGNLFKWFKVIWTDRDWDYYFIYKILHKKLDLMEKHIREHNNHTNSKKDADKIKKCVLILERLIKDNYHENAFKNHDEKWGESEMVFSDIEDSDLQSLNIVYPKVKTPEDKEQQRKEFKRAMSHSENLKQQDIEFLFETMKNNIQSWWD